MEMRLMLPKIIKASRAQQIKPTMVLSTAKASSKTSTKEFICTPGSKSPGPITASTAKSLA